MACHLLMETDVVLLDQPTRGMDIFDTFFLVEYLRQWACRGRIVVREREGEGEGEINGRRRKIIEPSIANRRGGRLKEREKERERERKKK